MNPLTPAQNQVEYKRKIEDITLCGKNRGPHDYIPTSWVKDEQYRHVTMLMCRVCFTRVMVSTLYKLGFEAKLPETK